MEIALDKFTHAIINSTFAVAILGNVSERDYALVELDTLPLPEETRLDFTQRGFEFLGVIATPGDRPHCAFGHDFDRETVSALLGQFLQLYESELDARLSKTVGDSVEWLQRLHALPDLRNGMN